MALRDASCYELNVEPSRKDPAILELKERNDEVRYARVREQVEGEAYSSALYDAFSGAKLASAGYVMEKLKTRRLELHGPDVSVGMEFTGRLHFEWTFIFEGNKYKWKRDLVGKDMVCSLDRKPEPSVEVCLAREGNKRDFPRISLLHYNIERFHGSDIQDVRGLEYLLVMSVLCLMDAAEERQSERAASTGLLRTPSGSAPKPPPKESPPVGSPPQEPARIITADDFEPEETNEIIVGMQTDIQAHIDRAIALLYDPNILFIVIRTKQAEAAQRALQVVSGIIRARHRNGEPELHQYVKEEQPPPPPGPRVINLDDPKPEPWRPPLVAVYLSTIELPDLAPGRREAATSPPSAVRHPTKGKATPVIIAPQPSRHGSGGSGSSGGGGKAHSLPNVRLSPSPEPPRPSHSPNGFAQQWQHPAQGQWQHPAQQGQYYGQGHGKQASYPGQGSYPQQSPPVPPAPAPFGRPTTPQNGKLAKPPGQGEKNGPRISRLFKGRA